MSDREDDEDDEIVAEVRAIRAKIAEECNYDLKLIAARASKIPLPPGS